ncbi:hypothetical protein AMB3_2230 [plant metagenome]
MSRRRKWKCFSVFCASRCAGAFLRLPRHVFVKCVRRSSANENYYQMTSKHNSLFFPLQADEHRDEHRLAAACSRPGPAGKQGRGVLDA